MITKSDTTMYFVHTEDHKNPVTGYRQISFLKGLHSLVFRGESKKQDVCRAINHIPLDGQIV